MGKQYYPAREATCRKCHKHEEEQELVSHVNTAHLHQQKIVNKFPKLFRGLGTIEREYESVLTRMLNLMLWLLQEGYPYL